jgi:transcriptional regulator with XRE-family HTH domain
MAGVYEHISGKIRDLRRAYGGQGISQEVLAEKLKTNANTVSRWETGTYKPSAEELAHLAKFFGVPVAVFFPDASGPDEKTQAFLAALGDLDDEDRDELVTYAQFRKAKRILEQAHRGEQPGQKK